MRLIFLYTAFLLTAHTLAVAADPVADWKGVKIMPKWGVVFRDADGNTVKFFSPEPWTVADVDGERLYLNSRRIVWVQRDQIVTLEEAPAYYTHLIDSGEYKAWAYSRRSKAWEKQGDLDRAIADFGEYLLLEPSAWAYDMRGLMWSSKDCDKAIADFDEALRLDPDNADYHSNRGLTYVKSKNYEKGVADFQKALRLAPEDAGVNNDAAMLMATCPDERYRNGKKAIELATKACELRKWKSSHYLDTLAAAYAESGDFDSAIKHQKKAIEMNPTDADFINGAKERLALYEEHKPYREE